MSLLRNAGRTAALQTGRARHGRVQAHGTRHLSRRQPAGRISLFGVSVLIVEDEPLIALDLHAALSAAGAGIIAATDTDEALRLLHHRVPFLFHTGHANARLLQGWPQVPVLIKPVSHQEIVARVAQLVY
jgi:hypothetical protein